MREPKPNLVQLSIISLRTSSNLWCNLAHYGDKTCSDAVLPDQRRRTLRLIREGVAVTRADLARETGLARSTVAQRVDALLEQGLVYEAGGSASTGGRPATGRVQPRSRRRPRRRPRRDARPSGGERSRRHAARRAGLDLDIAVGRRRRSAGLPSASTSSSRGGPRSRRRVRNRNGRTGPVEFDSGRPVNPPIMPGWDDFAIPEWFEAGTGRRCSSTTTSTSWRSANTAPTTPRRASASDQGGHGHRLRHRGGRPHPPRARAARPGTSATSAPPTERTSCRCGNVGCLEAIAAVRHSRNGSPLKARAHHVPAATSSASCGAATPARSGWCATPGAHSARCSQGRSTSSIPR